MLLAYSDESGHAADPKCRHVGMAGLIASSEGWDRADKLWLAALEKHRVQHFHMRHFAHSLGEFSGWPEDRRRSLMNDLLNAVVSITPTIVGSVISMEAWRAQSEDYKAAFLDPYYCCLQEFVFLADVHGATVGDDRVSIILSQNTEFDGRAKSLAEILVSSSSMPGSLSSITYADMRERPGLQAADLIAYETVLAHDQLARGERKVRYPFQRIRGNDSFFRYMDGTYLQAQLAGTRLSERQ